MRRPPRLPAKHASTRRGVAALLVLICLSFATVVATLLVQAALAERKYANRIERTYQADWLVEAGIDRAAAQIANSSNYKGETWPISLKNSDRKLDATVHIELKPTADPHIRTARIKAEIHGDGPTKFESHKEVRLRLP
jgi:hypothetical protein